MLTAGPSLVVDLSRAGEAPDPLALAAARDALAQLACASIGLRAAEPSPAGAALLDRLDVVVSSAAELEQVTAAVERTPLAALALVQLLRHGEALDVHEALIAESLVYSTLQSGPEFAAWLAARQAPRRRRADPGPAVEVRRDGDRLELRLNRPAKRNAFSCEMRDALAEALQLAVCDPSVQVVLCGAGPSFCSGGDLDEFGSFPDPATAHAIRSTRSPARLLAACAERVRVEVHGACVGAGIELPAFARQVVAREDAFFQLPEVGMGLVPGAGGTVSIPRRVGRQRAAFLALTGARLDVATARRWGLVDDVRLEGQGTASV
ncbi:MAG: enoyl-CoA hydratase/isomerase family protein [Myxococcota bacterium]